MLRSEYMAGFVVGENLSPDFNDKRENCISIGQLLAEIRYFGQEHRQHQIVSLQQKKKEEGNKKNYPIHDSQKATSEKWQLNRPHIKVLELGKNTLLNWARVVLKPVQTSLW